MGASARAAAFSALAAGFEVMTADLFADSDLAARCPAAKMRPDPDAFVRWLAEQQVDGWLATGSWENYPDHVDQMAKLRPQLGCHAATLRACKQPGELASLFAVNDVPFPETEFDPPAGEGWLVKALTSAGGLGVNDWQPSTAIPEGRYWQQKIEGRPISAAYVAAEGRAVLLGVTEQLIGRRWTHSQPFHYAGSVGPLDIISPVQITRVGELLAREFGVVGLFGVDFILDDTGTAWVVDVNPRYTASMEVVEHFTGTNMVATHVSACTRGELPSSPPVPTGYAGKSYLFAKRNVTFRQPPELQLADIPYEGDVIPRGKPICTLLADAEEYVAVERTLRQYAKQLESWLFSDEA